MGQKIAILQAGVNNVALSPDQPDATQMVRQLITNNCDTELPEIVNFPIIHNIFPEDISEFSGFLITGSASGVYEDDPWIAKLLDVIVEIVDAEIPLVGICFGHQAIAKALGGEVVKSPKGWGLGIREVGMTDEGQSLPDGEACLKLIYVHQDQVVKLPKDAVRLAGDEFCPNASFKISDKILTFQGHPEFTPSYVHELYDALEPRVGAEKAAQAHKSMSEMDDGQKVGKWIVSFLNRP